MNPLDQPLLFDLEMTQSKSGRFSVRPPCQSYSELFGTVAERRGRPGDNSVMSSWTRPRFQAMHVRGSNYYSIHVFPYRIPEQAIIMSVIDNLVKGASGQAV